MPKPNVIIIVADQLHRSMLGCMGNRLIHTPNIDRLAASGVLFENAFCQSPLCVPSRGSFNTGYYPHAARTRHNPVMLPPDVPTLAERLRADGYHTAAFGHIGADGIARGCEVKLDWDDGPLREAILAESAYVLEGNHLYSAATCGAYRVPEDKLFDSVATAHAVNYIHSAQEPFYLQLDFYGPHIAWFAPQRFIDLYDPNDIPLPDSWRDSLDGKPTNVKATRVATRLEGISEKNLREALRHYYAKISFVDYLVGRVINALEEKGFLSNSIITFFSDHGEYAGEFGLIGKTGQFYDCLTHVPLIMSAPPSLLPANQRRQQVVELVDVVPTLLELTGSSVTDDLQGKSLQALMKGEEPDSGGMAFAMISGFGGKNPIRSDHDWKINELKPGRLDPYSSGPCSHPLDGIMVRTDCHKLVVYGDGAREFYDLQSDPHELVNRSGDSQYSALENELMTALLQWQMRTWSPEIPQQHIPYHYRSFIKKRVPEDYHSAWDEWAEIQK